MKFSYGWYELWNSHSLLKTTKLSITLLIIEYFFVGAFVKNRILFALLRLVCGMGGMGVYMVAAVIAAEATLPRYVKIMILVNDCQNCLFLGQD